MGVETPLVALDSSEGSGNLYLTNVAVTVNHAVQDAAGNTLTLAEGDVVHSVIVSVATPCTSGGAATFTAGLAATDGGAVAFPLSSALALGVVEDVFDANLGGIYTVDNATNVYVSLSTAVAAVTAGDLKVTIVIV